MTLLEVAKIYVKSQLRLWLASSAVTRLNVSYRWINHLQQEVYIAAVDLCKTVSKKIFYLKGLLTNFVSIVQISYFG